ncbi:hypothetical protein [Bacillus sp. CH30_1T]|uniref:hypothetical protein n=1 Tax=Bacillus sp. CH30_1T TaxID=2604836 RepID=UPI00165E1751|nr:hypothetical protein [Bacillus sp. CH30_1T]
MKNFTLSASRLMKAGEVRNLCKEMRDNPTFLLAVEIKAKNSIAVKMGVSHSA